MQETSTFYAGYHRIKITPPFGSLIPGYGPLIKRFSDGIITDLYIYAVAIGDGENTAVLFNADALEMSVVGAARVKKLVAERCKIPEDNVYFCCTHSHTAVWLSTDEYQNPGDYMPRILQSVCDAATLAIEDMKPCTIKTAVGNVKGVGFVRRYLMRDGSVKTNPKTADPDIVRPDGLQDDSITLVRLIRDGAKEILIANFGTHPDMIDGTKYCADWPGYTVDTLKAAFGGEVEAVMLNGAQGDSNHINRFWPKGHYSTVAFSQRVGRILTGEIMKIYDDAKEIPYGPVKGYFVTVPVDKNTYTEEDVPMAEKINACMKEKGELTPELAAYGMSYKKAVRILRDLKLPKQIPVEVSGLQIGSLAFIGISGEPFCEIGIHIKEASPLDTTCVTCLTNGGHGYFPSAHAYEGGGYESDYSPFGPGCEACLVNGAKNILDQMKNAL